MDKKNFKNMWVYIEHDGKQVHPVALELCCETRRLCDESGDKLIAVIAGALPESEIDKIKDCGIDGVIYVSGTGYDRYNTEAYTNLFTVLINIVHIKLLGKQCIPLDRDHGIFLAWL